MDAIVVGAGVMGASTAYALSRAGVNVTLLEQFAIGHTRGSSHGRSRIFRFSYPDPLYVGMAQESLELWREFEVDSGETLVITSGGFDFGGSIEKNATALEESGIAFEMLDGAEVARRFPFLSVASEETALFHPDAGISLADKAVQAFVAQAAQNGADVRERTRVLRIEETTEGVRVETEPHTFTADVVVVTAGGWARPLLATLGIELPTRETRETISYYRWDGPTPPTLVEWGDPTAYALPSPGQGLKVGLHAAGPETDPNDEGMVDEDSVRRAAEWIARRLPSIDSTPFLAETCIYTNTSDEHFILERQGKVIIGSPCSGHGFKFAPLIGRRLAALAVA
jgi:sarcosine oxidase